ncbi:succinic semialdehyde dehydrogenase [Corynebacterium epidermidicanis]|uniref:NAD-dependent aldehyde dehydrogenase n=1 Tax=Corynebacterium epidermidicanis TaxID=1050174 RepID=A0A0G3GXQ2_9CORY|nr:succinic semialdehyde dehydrogenase [Corynebacterium epidermidicanis]AKK04308.1 NAD-dependent aldehyde dehydrogenase [Corynebacterium epidermidicanis]
MDTNPTQTAFTKARHAQQHRPTTRELSDILLRYHDLILTRQTELLDTIQAETGKARAHAFDEVLDVAITARHYAKIAPKALKQTSKKGALPVLTKTRVQREPIGVVGIIAPWNYPLSLAISDAIPAIMAGNAVVLKPDTQTPRTAQLAAEILYQAGLPRDLLHVVPGSGSDVGQAIAHTCDYLMFTGSTATGRKLGAIAGERLIGYSAELGGKNPLIIDETADPEQAARIAVQASFANSGQLCISIERIYVAEALRDAFLDAFVRRTKALRVGIGGWDYDMGSLISAEHAHKVHEYVQDAVAKGAQVLTGGTPPEGKIYQPTVLIDVPDTAHLKREEVFGPVVFVEAVGSAAEAVEKANDTDYGLNAAVVGRPKQAQAIARQLHAGTVNINEGFAAAWASVDAPMGGWKASGVGRRHGVEGILKFTETRTVAEQRLLPIGGPENLSREKYAKVMTSTLRLGKRFL